MLEEGKLAYRGALVAQRSSQDERNLSDDALGNFDVEFRDLRPYLAFLQRSLSKPPSSVLDVGGGNGFFLDRVLETYPDAEGVLVDNAAYMTERNRAHRRKTTVLGDARSLAQHLPGKTFDLITINLLLHHLVGDTLAETHQRTREFVEQLRPLLSHGGRLAVLEQVYDGWHPGPSPGALVYLLTRIRHPVFAQPLKRMGANTAGVGVRFRSRSGWRALFQEAGFQVSAETPVVVDQIPLPRRVILNVGYWATHIFVLEEVR